MIRPCHCRPGLLLAALAAVLLLGCNTFKQRVVAPPPDTTVRTTAPPKTDSKKDLPIAQFRNRRYYVHQVRWPNESLELIAQWYTGSRTNWKKLAQATPNLRQNRLYHGNVVFIPLDLLQIETPMPKRYVQQNAPPPAVSEPANPSRGGEAPPRPYGPRPYPRPKTP